MINEQAIPNDVNIRDVVRSEYAKCAKDPVYFMRKYCMIQHPVKGRILFNLYKFQEDTLRELQQFNYNIILKSRQLGISTIAAGYSMWLMNFHSDKNILVIATNQNTAKNLVTKIRFMYQHLPSWMKEGFVEDNKLSLKLKNGSQVKAVASSESSGRSEAISLLLIDEMAFIQSNIVELIWTSAQQTLGTGGQAMLLSTPNGQGNFYHKMWMEAEEGLNGFNTIKLPWYVHPERDDNWRREQDKLLGAREAAQECIAGHHKVTIINEDGIELTLSIEELYNTYKSFFQLQILTPSGFQKFKSVSLRQKNEYLKIYLSTGQIITCSLDHKLFSRGREIFARDLKTFEPIDMYNQSPQMITFIEYNRSDIPINLYDIVEVEDHLFVFDSIISHNCVDGSRVITIEDENGVIRDIRLDSFYTEIYGKDEM